MTHYDDIAREHRRYYGEGDRHLRIYRRLYDDETHFVYELIQNANDSRSTSLSFVLRDAELLVVNDGRRFNEEEKYVTVEVEAAFPGGNNTGMWQAVAYKHVFAAELGVACDQVRGFLVAPAIPDSIKTSCRQYGVEPFEVGDGA
jgi:hypothetical protein